MQLSDAADLVLRRAQGLRSVTDAEAIAVEGDRLEVGVRLAKTEKVKRARDRRLALRVFAGQSSAVVSTTDITAAALHHLVDEAARLASATAVDPWSGLADVDNRPIVATELDLFDPSAGTITAEEAIAIALRAEEAALDCDPRVTNSEGAELSASTRRLFYATSRGCRREQESSSFSLSVVPVAADQGSLQRDYWYTAARHRSALEDAASIGRTAAARALRRLGARSVATRQVPVVFDPETAATLIGHLAGAVSGTTVYRGLSFLRERMGTAIAPAILHVVDDPLRRAGLASRAFDAEGLTSRRNIVVDRGVLRTYLLDTYSARRLNLSSTASAVRSLGEPPTAGATNLFLEAGRDSPADIVASVRDGLYVTELIGSGVNSLTGDYSRGAAGVWIESGELAFPVEGITIAGNLVDMLASVEAVGSDLTFRSSISAPTLKIARMTVAGEA